ncbi:MAG: hypothetical protein OXR67_11230 [Chloroflexota bacterium]|nr:hypothetical protein [Chloroflexota bacterium]
MASLPFILGDPPLPWDAKSEEELERMLSRGVEDFREGWSAQVYKLEWACLCYYIGLTVRDPASRRVDHLIRATNRLTMQHIHELGPPDMEPYGGWFLVKERVGATGQTTSWSPDAEMVEKAKIRSEAARLYAAALQSNGAEGTTECVHALNHNQPDVARWPLLNLKENRLRPKPWPDKPTKVEYARAVKRAKSRQIPEPASPEWADMILRNDSHWAEHTPWMYERLMGQAWQAIQNALNSADRSTNKALIVDTAHAMSGTQKKWLERAANKLVKRGSVYLSDEQWEAVKAQRRAERRAAARQRADQRRREADQRRREADQRQRADQRRRAEAEERAARERRTRWAEDEFDRAVEHLLPGRTMLEFPGWRYDAAKGYLRDDTAYSQHPLFELV